MITAALALGGIGLLAALGLGVAAKVFYVKVDPLVAAVDEALPGANCGGCGYAGCSSAAEAMAAGNLAPNACVGSGPETHAEVAALLGVELTDTEPEIAKVGCRYPVARADIKYDYLGAESCRAAVVLHGGPKECPVGCIGLGSCVASCPFNALKMGADGLPVIDEARCTGCGTCVRTCPVGIMHLTSVTNRILNEYKWTECTAPCQRACPAGIDVPEQIRLTALGKYDEALMVIKERNPLPLICGRICPHPCEFACRRNLADEPVAINYLKRYVSDYERTSGKRLELFKAPETGQRAAVIGGGVEGLTASAFLVRLGHEAEIYEAMDKLGGLLRTVIPKNRLPRDVLDFEIEGILQMGVKAQTGMTFGTDVTLAGLFDEGYDRVLIATGGWDSLLLRNPVSTPAPALPRMFLLLPLSLAWSAGQNPDLGSEAVFVGGGRTALDAALTAASHGLASARVLLRRAAEDYDFTAGELDQAAGQGVGVIFGARVDTVSGVGDAMTGLTYTDADGDQVNLAVDSIVAAAGRLPEMIIIPEEMDPEAEAIPGSNRTWTTALTYRLPSAKPRGLFDVSEPVSDYKAAVEAIGAGRRAAASIHASLTKQPIAPPEKMITPQMDILTVDQIENLLQTPPRQQMPVATAEERLDPDFEIELGFDEELAKKEARRCLNCGLICYYRSSYGGVDLDRAAPEYYTLRAKLERVHA